MRNDSAGSCAESYFAAVRRQKYNINRLAALAALPPSSVKNILYGRSRNPKLLTIKLICDGLGLSLSEFFDSEDFDKLDIDV